MRIPAIRDRLNELARQHGISELHDLANELTRRPARRVAPIASAKMTEALRSQIRAYAQAHPVSSQAEIGAHFNVNPGRVSEALRGGRT